MGKFNWKNLIIEVIKVVVAAVTGYLGGNALIG